MLTITTPFTDCHGIDYLSPIVQISQANYNSNSSVQVGTDGDAHVQRHSSVSHNLSYQANIWIDAAAKADGKRPLTLKDKNGNDWHSITLATPLADTATIIAECEQHVLSTIIPQLQG